MGWMGRRTGRGSGRTIRTDDSVDYTSVQTVGRQGPAWEAFSAVVELSSRQAISGRSGKKKRVVL